MLDKTFSEISNGSPNHSHIHWFCWQNGVVSCTSVRCPVLNCIDPVYELGKCCPSCSSDKCVVEGRTYRSGDSFCLPSDPCQECHCLGSKATCAKRSAPRLGVGIQPSWLANVVQSVKVGINGSNLCSRIRNLRIWFWPFSDYIDLLKKSSVWREKKIIWIYEIVCHWIIVYSFKKIICK